VPGADAGAGLPGTRLTRAADASPAAVAVAGAVCTAWMPIFIALASVSTGTVAMFRFLLAWPVLEPLARAERRRSAPRSRRTRGWAFASGVLLGADVLMWNQAIIESGAGIATVIANAQVVVLPALAFVFAGERPGRRYLFALPVMVIGVALAGGVVDPDAFGRDPVKGALLAVGAAVGYAGYLFLLRQYSGGDHVVGPVTDATVGALATAIVGGLIWQGIDVTPGWEAFLWLVAVALTGQVVGWLLIGAALPRLSAAAGGSLLLVQPVGSVALGALVLAERPSALQLVGCAVVLGAVYAAAGVGGGRRESAAGGPPGR
jgi:drug/metabolite transporter (DMT)-like permease